MSYSDIRVGHPSLRFADRRKNSRLLLGEEYEKMVFGLETSESDVIRYLLTTLPAHIPAPKDSVERIIDRIGKTLGRQALRLKMDEGNRRELIYRSFEVACRKFGEDAKFANGRHFGSWWSNNLAYQCRNWYSRKANRMVSVASRSESKSESYGLDMANFASGMVAMPEMSSLERAEILQKGIAALEKAGLSQIWELHAQGFKGKEIARRLGMFESVVSVRLSRARDILRGCLG